MSTAHTTLATPPALRTLQRTTMTTPRRPGTRSRRSLLAALLATLLSTIVLPALASAATAPIPRAAPPGVYLARLPERDAYLAVLVDHHSAAAYLCDDGTVAKWFPHRRITLGAISLRARDHRARLTARTTRTDGLTGRGRLHGHRYAFTARPAPGPPRPDRARCRGPVSRRRPHVGRVRRSRLDRPGRREPTRRGQHLHRQQRRSRRARPGAAAGPRGDVGHGRLSPRRRDRAQAPPARLDQQQRRALTGRRRPRPLTTPKG